MIMTIRYDFGSDLMLRSSKCLLLSAFGIYVTKVQKGGERERERERERDLKLLTPN